jgi:hypothetical protein
LEFIDVNRTLVAHPDVTVPPFYTAHITRTNALVLTAGLHSRGRDYEPFLGIICNALAPLTVSAHVSQQWTRYVVNGIPTDATPEDAREELEMLYPAAKLAKTPRWLTTAENRQSKAASSMNLTDSDIERVSSPEKMLNDEVINSYLSLLTMHFAADRAVHLPPQFWTSYASHGYDKVMKWLPKCWSPDHTPGILLIPINQNLHWFLISVDFARRQTKMLLFNRECDVREHIPFRDTTQCSRCQLFGHPAALCKAATACAICAQPHLTHHHPCTIPGCPKGRRCTHPPLCCALCQQPHKATDRSCPTYLALARSEDEPGPSDAPCLTPEEDAAMNGQ